MSDEITEEAGWEVNIKTQEDAQRFARIGGYAGFTYIFFTTFLAVFGIVGGLSQMEKMPEIEAGAALIQSIIILVLFLRFALYWVWSWRTHSGRGIIAAPLLCLFIVGEILFAVFGMVSQGMVPGLLLIILAAVFGFVLITGVKGNWANWTFSRRTVG